MSDTLKRIWPQSLFARLLWVWLMGLALVLAAAERSQTPVTRIGHITAGSGVQWQTALGQPLTANWQSFDHFAQ